MKKNVIQFMSQNDYLAKRQKTNEDHLKEIINKYYQNETLMDEEYALVQGYFFYSNPNTITTKKEDSLLLKMKQIYGTGTFNEEELKTLNKINDEYKKKPKKR